MTQEWDLGPEEVLALPLDELALRVLRNAVDSGERNWRTWLLGMRKYYGRGHDALTALSEAWGWILNHGLVAWDQDQAMEFFVLSRKGHAVLDEGLPWLRATERLDVELLPALERTARPQFLRGDFETAAFVAMKEVEVQVRRRAGLSDSLVGTKLAQEAFRPPKTPGADAGSLWREELDPGESVAQMELFKGAIGLFKNPSSHRRVDFTDATEAAEIVLLADLLLRLLGKIDDSPPAAERADGSME